MSVWDEPIELCRYCKTECRADWCDVGVPGAMQQVGPFHCEACGASQIGPYDKARPLSEDEKRTGWYAPGSEPGSSANVIGGRVVSHEEMRDAYRAEFAGNPAYDDPGVVDEWWERIRRREGTRR